MSFALSKRNRRYGCIPDKDDHKRDQVFSVARLPILPKSFDNSDLQPATHYDQGQTSSCTGNGTAGAICQLCKIDSMDFLASRLQLYFNGRRYEGTTNQDCGAMIRDVIKGFVRYGAAPETLWPFDENKVCVEPSAEAQNAAQDHQLLQYRRILSGLGMIDLIKLAISQRLPVVFGATLFESFESDATLKTGIVPMPNERTERVLGGHCMRFRGYDDASELLRTPNSWGEGVGDKGDFYLPYSYVKKYASDIWVLSKMEEPAA